MRRPARASRASPTSAVSRMAVLSGPSRLALPGGLAPVGGPVAWIADNQLKGISAEPSVTIHANHAFSLERWKHDRQERAVNC